MATSQAAAVWIDANSATIVRWGPDAAGTVHFESDVPPHRRSTGQVTARRGERHGGTGPRSAGEQHRLEHLRTFLAQVRRAVPADDLLLLGDGVVVERLAAALREDDATHGRRRRIEVRRHGPLTEAQLVAAVRAFAGAPARRVRVATG